MEKRPLKQQNKKRLRNKDGKNGLCNDETNQTVTSCKTEIYNLMRRVAKSVD